MRRSRRRFLASVGVLALSACAQLPPGAKHQSGYAEVNGTRLYYEVAGSGDPVVLLHAFTLDTRMWDGQFDVLAEKFRVIRYDARGFGKSDVPKAGEAYSHHADLLALVEKLDARNAHLVGSSMGGRFALDFAVTYPDRYRSLTVIDTVIGGWPWSKAFLDGYQPVIDAGRRKDIPAAKAAWLAQPLFAAAREQPAVAVSLQRMVDDYSGWHFVNRDPAVAPVPPTLSQLARLGAPTLVIVGARDMVDFQRMAGEIARQGKRTKAVTISRAGHMVNMESPAEVNAALLEFLSGS